MGGSELTHLPLDNMAAISQIILLKCIFMNNTFCNFIQISMKFVSEDPIGNKSGLVQVIA